MKPPPRTYRAFLAALRRSKGPWLTQYDTIRFGDLRDGLQCPLSAVGIDWRRYLSGARRPWQTKVIDAADGLVHTARLRQIRRDLLQACGLTEPAA